MSPDKPKNHPNHQKDNLYCGTCQWFTAGYDGNNCQKIRGIEVSDPACIEYTNILPDPYHEIAKDKYLEYLRKDYTSSVLKIDDSVHEELKSYVLDADKLNHQFATDNDIESLQKALTDIVSHRSRVSSIYFAALDAKSFYEKVEERSDMWLYSKYPKMRDLKNAEMRNNAKNRLIPERIDVANNIKKTIRLIEYVNSKIDKNDYTVQKKLESTMKTWGYRKGLNNLR